ncbi:hypothetical protein T492DRAFT_884045, partial [Pavlovales sp. CCMP2436]
LEREDGCTRDLVESAKWLQIVAGKGDIEALLKLAHKREVGEGVPQDLGAMSVCLGKAAMLRHSRAHEQLRKHLNACVQCKVLRACSTACMRSLWSEHKLDCKKWPADPAGSSKAPAEAQPGLLEKSELVDALVGAAPAGQA